jgi:hypothetical protein
MNIKNFFFDFIFARSTAHLNPKVHLWLQASTTNCRSGFDTTVGSSTTSGQRLPQLGYQSKPSLEAWYNMTIQLQNHNTEIYKRPMTPSDDFRSNTVVRVLVPS